MMWALAANRPRLLTNKESLSWVTRPRSIWKQTKDARVTFRKLGPFSRSFFVFFSSRDAWEKKHASIWPKWWCFQEISRWLNSVRFRGNFPSLRSLSESGTPFRNVHVGPETNWACCVHFPSSRPCYFEFFRLSVRILFCIPVDSYFGGRRSKNWSPLLSSRSLGWQIDVPYLSNGSCCVT